MEAARLRAERQENSGQGSSTKFTFDPTSRVRIFSVSILISSLLTSEMAMADPWSAMDQTNQPVRPSQEAKNGDCLPVRL